MDTKSPPRAVLGTPHRPFRRGVDNAILGGVCGGLAIRLGVRERTVRIVFSLLALASGFGLLLYMLCWLTLPRANEERSVAHRLVGRRRELHRVLFGLILVIAFIVILDRLGIPSLGIYTWPVLLSLAAVIGVWRGATLDEQHHLEDLLKSAPLIRIPAGPNKKSLLLRVLLGVVLVLLGLHTLSRLHGDWGGAAPELVGTLILIVGVLVLLAPWWLATLSELSGERRARVRVEERANVAAHLHDSVLQTLTLIERAAADPSAVVRLARNQERELRQWLFDPEQRTPSDGEGTFSTQLHALESEIENDYGVRVELVVVGDCPATVDVVALIAAGREAAINAAQWSGATTVSMYAEVEETAISLFVRDQGKGFDVDTIPHDRQGIALSIRQRITQHGGTTSIKSTRGVGTDVELSLPRTP